MAAAIGNQYALGNKGGQPTKYRPEYCDLIIEHFTIMPQQTVYKRTYFPDGTVKSEDPVLLPEQFPTFEKFADSIGVHKDTMYQWGKEYKEFSDSLARAKQLQEHIWLVNGMSNLYNSQFAQFFGKNCLGYSDKQEIALTGSDGGPIQVQALNTLDIADLLKLEEIMSKALPEVVDITPNDD